MRRDRYAGCNDVPDDAALGGTAGVGSSLRFAHLTRRLGAIVSGPIIAFGSMTPLGYGGIFAACAVLTVLGLIVVGLARQTTRPQ